MKPYIELTIGLARTGITGFGGGPSVIPLIEYEAVKKYKWVTEKEFGDTLALANTLPGPIATKMCAYLGYKLKGNIGAVIAVLAHIIPSTAAMMGLLGFIYAFRTSPVISGMVAGVTPVIGLMLLDMAIRFYNNGQEGLGIPRMLGLSAVSLIIIQMVGLHPGILIILFLLIAFVIAGRKEKSSKSSEVLLQRKESNS